MSYPYWRTERLILDAVGRRILRRATISDRIVSTLSDTDLLAVAAFFVIGLFASLAAMLTAPDFGQLAKALHNCRRQKEFANIGRIQRSNPFRFAPEVEISLLSGAATDQLLQNRRLAPLGWARRWCIRQVTAYNYHCKKIATGLLRCRAPDAMMRSRVDQ